jgi:hypothetical protein
MSIAMIMIPTLSEDLTLKLDYVTIVLLAYVELAFTKALRHTHITVAGLRVSIFLCV